MSEDSYSGRVHISSSVPRTRFTAKTPRSEREGIENLRTKMTFSDHSVSCGQQIIIVVAIFHPLSQFLTHTLLQPNM